MSVFDRRLVVVGGKGGVGRTTVAAALALAAARRGRRVLLAQSKSKERLSSLLGGPPVGTEIVRVRDNLEAVNVYPDAALREYGLMVLRSALVYRAVFENRLSRAFIRAIPGVDDYSILGKVWYHTTEEDRGRPRYDMVIFDGPATGHVVTLLQIPQAILDAVPEGPLTRDASSARELLRDAGRTAMLLVTLAEEMPTNETIELAARLRERVGIALGPLVINQLYPPRFVAGPSARALDALPESAGDDAGDPLGPMLHRARIAMRRRRMNDVYLERLGAQLSLPQVQLPYLFAPRFGAAETEDLSHRLEGQLLAAATG
jgi:anion-transporting  ArsA/GET3 family ATPase